MEQFVQATCIAVKNQAILIQGRPGVGKTTLALQLIERGASLISDDVTQISLENNKIFCKVKAELYGKFELKGLGIIQGMPVCSKAPLTCIIKLSDQKKERCPFEIKQETFFEKKVPVFEFFSCETTYLSVLYALRIINGELTLLKE